MPVRNTIIRQAALNQLTENYGKSIQPLGKCDGVANSDIELIFLFKHPVRRDLALPFDAVRGGSAFFPS